ncbi:MAG: glycosyltransferase family A protein [Parabacteroides distasonis]
MKNDLTLAICMYNAERYIEETLQCIMAQTMQNFQLLIVNDCSTDNSMKVVKHFFENNPRQYELISFKQNGGLCAGRRYIEEHATTRYLLFVDADDCPYPTLVEKLYAAITSDSGLMAVGCYLEYMDSDGRKMNGGIFLGEKSKEAFYEKAAKGKLIFMQPTAIYDRYVALSVGGHCIEGFPEGKPRYQDLCEDLDLWTRMSDLYNQRKAIVVVPEVLCRYRKHEQALSANSIGMILRMKHIKTNVKRRRSGKKDLTFTDFLKQLSKEEYRKIEKDASAADSLRKAYYTLKKGKIFASLKYLIVCLWNNPVYLPDKIRHNLLRK